MSKQIIYLISEDQYLFPKVFTELEGHFSSKFIIKKINYLNFPEESFDKQNVLAVIYFLTNGRQVDFIKNRIREFKFHTLLVTTSMFVNFFTDFYIEGIDAIFNLEDFNNDDVIEFIREISQVKELEKSNFMQEEAKIKSDLQSRKVGLIFESEKMYDVIKEVFAYAPLDMDILLLGETGVGKDVIANIIHELSNRKEHNLFAINCASLQEHLVESELFGHVKGAFTGAIKGKKGLFELANQSTLFLDEIGELKPEFQSKLLRVMNAEPSKRKISPVGSESESDIDVRIVAATNIDISEAVKNNKFRSDLLYRFGKAIIIPPLRERPEDIPVLADYFIKKFNTEKKKEFRLSTSALEKFIEHPWHGNVRELKETIQRTCISARSDLIDVEDIQWSYNL